jgi:hypothetical protein
MAKEKKVQLRNGHMELDKKLVYKAGFQSYSWYIVLIDLSFILSTRLICCFIYSMRRIPPPSPRTGPC